MEKVNGRKYSGRKSLTNIKKIKSKKELEKENEYLKDEQDRKLDLQVEFAKKAQDEYGKKQKTTVYLSEENCRKLKLMAAENGCSASAIVDDLIEYKWELERRSRIYSMTPEEYLTESLAYHVRAEKQLHYDLMKKAKENTYEEK